MCIFIYVHICVCIYICVYISHIYIYITEKKKCFKFSGYATTSFPLIKSCCIKLWNMVGAK